MKMSCDQRFYWLEPFAFARARAASESGTGKLPLLGLLIVFVSIALVAVDLPESMADVAVVAAIAAVMALLITYPGMWLFSRIPNDVLVATDRIAIGRTVIPLDQIQSAVVGTTRIQDTEYPVLTFLTKSGQRYLFGLSRKVNAAQLASFLVQSGVREPQV